MWPKKRRQIKEVLSAHTDDDVINGPDCVVNTGAAMAKWFAKGAKGFMQWGVMAGEGNNGDGDKPFGMHLRNEDMRMTDPKTEKGICHGDFSELETMYQEQAKRLREEDSG